MSLRLCMGILPLDVRISEIANIHMLFSEICQLYRKVLHHGTYRTVARAWAYEHTSQG